MLADRLLVRNLKRPARLIELRREKLTFIEVSTCQALDEAWMWISFMESVEPLKEVEMVMSSFKFLE